MSSLEKFYTAVAIEHFSRPIAEDELDQVIEKYRNIGLIINRPERLLTMPAGSVMGKIIDHADMNFVLVFYPLFPHLSLPLKAGEQFFALYGSFNEGDRIGYWVTRKPTDLVAEDVNYAHNDRSNYGILAIKNKNTVTEPNKKIACQFPDIGVSSISYQKTVNTSDSYEKYFQGEAVPRYFPKSPDTSIQGSNNTLLVLGSNSTLLDDKSPNAGMIDIVAGRGQTPTTSSSSKFRNTRDYDEIDKTADIKEKEGELDLVNDLSRINISMNIDPDSAFQISAGDSFGTGPSIVTKSNHIRIVARSDLKLVVGSGSTQSSVIIKPDGNIVITPGSKIKLSSEDDDQPYLRYDEFNSIISSILDILGSLQTSLGPAGAAAAVTVAGGSIPGTLVGDEAINTAVLTANVERFKEIGISTAEIFSNLELIKSQKILGS